MKIGLVGCGNMGSSIATSLITSKKIDKLEISVFDKDSDKMEILQQVGARGVDDAIEAAKRSEIVILAIKPKDMQEVCNKISLEVSQKIVISIAAGTKISDLRAWLRGAYIFRAMPNLNSSAYHTYTALFRADMENGKDMVEKIFSAIGVFDWVQKEDELDALTAISGAGPAYIFRFAKEQLAFAREVRINEDVAKRAIYHTLFGSSKVLVQSPEASLDELIRKVASKGGVTQEVLKESEANGVWSGLRTAWRAGVEKSRKLG
jgi:pyrroline-5-carboxylate reductase